MSEPPSDARGWCEERLRQPGEDLHLARLFSPPEQRPVVTAAGAIYIELEAITQRFRDLNIARTKLAWWREELARLDAGRPAHPATQLLASSRAPPATTRLLDLVTGMEVNLLAGPAEDIANVRVQAERGFAPFLGALGAQLAGAGSDNANAYRRLGEGIGLARRLPARPARKTRAAMAANARDGLRDARCQLTASPPALRVLAALAWRRACRIEPAQPEIRESRRRVFLAWRAARGKLPRALRSR